MSALTSLAHWAVPEVRGTVSPWSNLSPPVGPAVFIVLTSILCIVLVGVAWDVYRTQRNYRRRKEAEAAAAMLWHKPPPLLPPTAPSPYKSRQNGSAGGGTGSPAKQPLLKSEPTSPVHVAPPVVPGQNGQIQQNGGKQIRFQGELRRDRTRRYAALAPGVVPPHRATGWGCRGLLWVAADQRR